MKTFPIIGIGGSSGGLEAFQELLENLSAKPGAAFVFIMHLSPNHKSTLTELLARSTKMPVSEIRNNMLVEINHVYVIPPGSDISIAHGKLMLSKRKGAGIKPQMPIDYFFSSLAKEQKDRAIGVVLSGTAKDGTLGSIAIKTEVGVVFAQDESAKYEGMPKSVVSSGYADFVLSPKKMAAELERIAKHSTPTQKKGLEGMDFTHYQKPTVEGMLSSNEELQSANEELQSTNEELETAKEELQSLNEELITTNEELQSRNLEVVLLNDDMINLLSGIDIPMVMLGKDLIIRRINNQTEKVLNISSFDIGTSIERIKLNVDIPNLDGKITKVIKSAKPQDFEVRNRTGRWYSLYIRPYITLDNKVEGAIMLFVDITDRKIASKAISNERDKAQKYLDVARAIFVVINQDGIVTLANKRACEILGYKEEELVGEKWFERFIPERGRKTALAIFEMVASGEKEEVEYYETPVLTKSGEEKMIAWHNIILRDEYDLITGTLNSGEDITDRKIAEDAVKEVQEALTKATNIKEEFLSFISHDLKSPLHVIKRAMDLLVENPNLDDAAKNHIALSVRQVKRGLKFVDNLLNLKKLKSGDVQLELSKFRFSDFIDEIIKDFRFILDQDSIDIKLFGSAIDHEVTADREKIGHVVGNIIDNALKHMPNGGSININVDVDEESNMLKVSISDTGDGITKDKLKKIFEHYEQAKVSDKDTGMGMGLAIAKYICELHGGKIWAESETGKGATIVFVIPNANISTEVRNILVVDDMADERTIARDILEKNNFNVYEANGWKEAMAKIHSCRIDAVLLDMQMSDMPGIEVLKLIRREKNALSLPVIIYSSRAVDDKLCLSLGANSCISKGVEAQELITTIKKFLH